MVYGSAGPSRALSNPHPIPSSSNSRYIPIKDSGPAVITGLADFYSLELSVFDNMANVISYTGGPYFAVFDPIAEYTGVNLFGSGGGDLEILEGIVDLGGGVQRYFTQITALNAADQPEPLVNSAFAGIGLIGWQFEVGTATAGNDPIEPGMFVVVIDSGFNVFDSAGQLQGTFPLLIDFSTFIGFAGLTTYTLGGADIAGADIATLQMFWDARAALLPEFDSDPAADSMIIFANTAVGETSDPETIAVNNLGDLPLSLACEITGADADEFAINDCPANVDGMGSDEVLVVCQPSSAGDKAAVLSIATNDQDELNNDYDLSCLAGTGSAILMNGFEGGMVPR